MDGKRVEDVAAVLRYRSSGFKFCSMKITLDVRDYAATLNDPVTVGLPLSGVAEYGMPVSIRLCQRL
jgi:hypothetical protein